MATFTENFAVAVLIASTTLGPVLAVPTRAELASSYWSMMTFTACATSHALSFVLLVVSVHTAACSLRHELVCRA